MTLNDDQPGKSKKHSQEGKPDYRIWSYVDPMAGVRDARKGISLAACLIGFVFIAVWVNAGSIVWRNLLD